MRGHACANRGKYISQDFLALNFMLDPWECLLWIHIHNMPCVCAACVGVARQVLQAYAITLQTPKAMHIHPSIFKIESLEPPMANKTQAASWKLTSQKPNLHGTRMYHHTCFNLNWQLHSWVWLTIATYIYIYIYIYIYTQTLAEITTYVATLVASC